MSKRVILVGSLFCFLFICGCSMTPSDDEILEGAVLENEIIEIDPIDVNSDEDIDSEPLSCSESDESCNISLFEDEESETDNGGSVDVSFEVVD